MFPELLVLGNVCVDRVRLGCDVEDRLGGAAAFSAQAAACLGVHSGVVTAVSASQASLLRPLYENGRIHVAAKSSPAANLFEVHWRPEGRDERVTEPAPRLALSDIPRPWRSAPVAYVAPLLHECSGELVGELDNRYVVVGAQGWLRALDREGWVKPSLASDFLQPPPNIKALVFSREDHPDGALHAERLATRGLLVALTAGAEGGSIYHPSGAVEHFAAIEATQRDPTGAGDTFGVVFALGLSHGLAPSAAAKQAARVAAHVVEGPGLGSLPGADFALRRAA